MHRPIYIAYYTIGTAYRQEAESLAASLRAFDLPHCVRGVPDPGNWMAATSYKPTFIRNMMLELEGHPLVYVDADARIRRPPDYFEDLAALETDLAAHWKGGTELLSGTLFIGTGPVAWTLIREWIAECAAHPDVWDQRCLQTVVDRHPEANIAKLPASYTAIFDAGMSDVPVIEHMQASRRLKR